MSNSKLSVVIITLNEEANIARCLNSVQKVADEIIVLDSGSTDKTMEICKNYNVDFNSTDWKGYSETKNTANSLARNEYILSLDADECLDDELAIEISELKKRGFNGAYSLNRLTNYCGKWIYFSGWNPDWKIRLFPKETVKWNNAIVHEELMLPKEILIRKLNGRLLHYSYTSTADHQQRADKYSVLTANKYAKQGKKASFLSPMIGSIGRFLSMYILKLGFLDGKSGFQIAYISAKSNALKYRELNKINKFKRE